MADERKDVPTTDTIESTATKWQFKPSTTPISTFPLPQELKDEIFSYVLLGDNVKRIADPGAHQQDGTGVFTYKFDTALFRVNKTLEAEARKYLYENNEFIKVNYEMKDLLFVLSQFDVPLVAYDTADKDRKNVLDDFTHHTHEVQLKWHGATYHHWIYDEVKNLDSFGSILLLRQDWPSFCDMLMLLGYLEFELDPAVLVVSDLNRPLRLDPPQIDLPQALSMTISKTGFKAPSAAKHKHVLCNTVIDVLGDDLRLIGFENDPVAQQTLRAGAPSLVWLRAQFWDFADSITVFKQRADEVARESSLQVALSRYETLTQLLYGRRSTFGVTAAEDDPVRSNANSRIDHLVFDMRMSQAVVRPRLGAYEDAVNSMFSECLPPAFAQQRLPPKTAGQYEHLKALAEFLKRCTDGRVDTANAFDFLGVLAHLPQDEYAEHDADVIRDVLFGEGSMGEEDRDVQVPVEKLSIHAMPLRTYDSYS